MAAPFTRHSLRAGAFIGTWLLLAAAGASAQMAGEVEFSRGVGFAQTPGQAPRTLGRGLPLREGDRLTTSDGASAIVKLQDGTRMTVRPNSELVLQQYQFKENSPDNSMLMQLVRGGFRAVTGLISKGSPNAARVQTNTATIGIRGTDFDARVCAKECGKESDQVSATSRPTQVQASAKIVAAFGGEVSAVDGAGAKRRLVDGGSVYPGDTVETAPGTRAMLAFRDDTRVTLGAGTKFRVDNFVYDQQNAGEGRFLASLLKGSVRALTGLIAKSNNRNVGFSTATATIGIRGTGFDMSCTGACETADAGPIPVLPGTPGAPATPGAKGSTGDGGQGSPLGGGSQPDAGGLSLFTWLGSIDVTPKGPNGQPGLTAMQILATGQGLFISPRGIVPISNRPPSSAPDPTTTNVPPKLFAKESVPDASEGLFVFVRDGHIEITTQKEVLQLGKGEVGYAANDGNTLRPINVPKFIEFDRMPLPNTKNPVLVSVLQDAGINKNTQCR